MANSKCGNILKKISVIGNKKNKFILNPSISFFKYVYVSSLQMKKKLLIEDPSTTIPNQQFETDLTLHYTIPNKGLDYLSEVYLNLILNSTSIDSTDNNIKPLFAYKKKLGFAIINEINISINNQNIETITGEWLNIWYELTNIYKNIDTMIGNTIELYNFSKSKKEVNLIIPIPVWFSKDIGSYFPIFKLDQNQNIHIDIKFNNFDDFIIKGPTHYLFIKENIISLKKYEVIQQLDNNNHYVYGLFIEYNIYQQKLYYIKLSDNNFIKNSNKKIFGRESLFQVTPNSEFYRINSNSINLTIKKSHLFINGIKLFNNLGYSLDLYKKKQDIYYISTPKKLLNIDIPDNNIYKFIMNGLSKELIWTYSLKYIYNKLDKFNYTYDIFDKFNNNVAKQISLYFDSNNHSTKNNFISNNKSIDYKFYNYLVPLFSHSSTPCIGINNINLCLYPEDKQVNGYINFTNKNIELELMLNLDTNLNSSAYPKSIILNVYTNNIKQLKIY